MNKWWDDPRIPLSPKWRLRLAWLWLLGSIVLWPVAAASFAREEPPAILGLSFLAITITALDVLMTSDVRATQQDKED